VLRGLYVEGTGEREDLERHVRPDNCVDGRGGGYVVDSLRSAKELQALDCYEEVVKGAIALGNDTDTTAAIAGGIAGVRFGVEGIPARWRGRLRGSELFEPLIERLLARGR
jgi:ADP-ribosylglycohydrolase